MSTSVNKDRVGVFNIKPSVTRLVLAIVLAGLSLATQAGKITSIPSTTVPGVQDGFGGFNLENISVILNDLSGTGSTFDESTGAYFFDTDSDLSYVSDVYDDVSSNLMGQVLAKPFPVGEPAGIKIVNDDFDVKKGRPTNCIMSTSYLDGHFLDEADPRPVPCSGPFQAHKRYKLAMLPSTVDGVVTDGTDSIDLVFNVEADGTTRDYQVFQKINNWTNNRLKGFTIQVGTGTGGTFVPAADTGGVGVANLSLSVPSEAWDSPDQLANFAAGLFGPADPEHDQPAGFFDPVTRAGFLIVEYPNVSGQTDTLHSGATLGSDYAAVPPATGAAANQFGIWLPNTMLPYGIFFDDDGNPDTDAELKAWYGDKSLNDFGWMTGVAAGFVGIHPDTITNDWSNNPLYFMGPIDDLVNVGLNYVVTVGDVSGFSNFTIRITPIIADAPLVQPTYVGVVPDPPLVYASSDAIIQLDPSPAFIPGSLLTARVADADLNNITDLNDDNAIESTTVEVTTSDGSVASYTLTLEELGENRGVFAGNLPDAFSNVAVGTTVIVTYLDVSGGAGGANESIIATSTAGTSLPSGNVEFNPASYTVAEDGGNVVLTVDRIDGTLGEVTVEYNTNSDSATGNEDYVPATGTLTFADGVTSQTITVEIINDTAIEGDESFTVLLSNAQGGAAVVGTNPATVTITDNDVAASDSSSGCSCSSSPGGSVDPLLPGLLLASLIYLGWRSKQIDIE